MPIHNLVPTRNKTIQSQGIEYPNPQRKPWTGPAAELVDMSGVESRLDDIADMLERLDRRLDLLEADDDIERIAGKVSEEELADTLRSRRTRGRTNQRPTDDVLATISDHLRGECESGLSPD